MKNTYERVLKALAYACLIAACGFAFYGMLTGNVVVPMYGMIIATVVYVVTFISATEMAMLYGEWF